MRRTLVVLATLMLLASPGLAAASDDPTDPARGVPGEASERAPGRPLVPPNDADQRGQATMTPNGGPSGEVGALASSENCGVKVNFPHASYDNSYQVHTRTESFCTIAYVSYNQLSATTYRSRWYGWENVGSKSAGPSAVQYLRVTVAVPCTANSLYRYRTNSRGYVTLNGTQYTAAAYEQNDTEIRCVY